MYFDGQIPTTGTNMTDEEASARLRERLATYRRVILQGELNAKSLSKAGGDLVKLEMQSSEPITLLLGSGGGDMDPTRQFIDTIESLNSPVDVVVMGDCASMAVDIVQMCRRRMMTPNARMLTHYIRSRQPWIIDDPDLLEKDISRFREFLCDVREERFRLYEKRTRLSRERLLELFRYGQVHGLYFSAKQALEYGFVDEIISDFKLFPDKPANS